MRRRTRREILALTGRSLMLVEKKTPAVSFYTLPHGWRMASMPLPTQPHEYAAIKFFQSP